MWMLCLCLLSGRSLLMLIWRSLGCWCDGVCLLMGGIVWMFWFGVLLVGWWKVLVVWCCWLMCIEMLLFFEFVRCCWVVILILKSLFWWVLRWVFCDFDGLGYILKYSLYLKGCGCCVKGSSFFLCLYLI